MEHNPILYKVTVHRDGPSEFWAEVDELPGCFASGESMDELWEALAEAMSMYLSSPSETITVTLVTGSVNVDDNAASDVEHRTVLVSA